MRTLIKLTSWLRTRKWIIVIAALLGLFYVGTDFGFFNELIHSAIKVFAVVTIGLGLRALAFPKSLGDYVDSGGLEDDLHSKGALDVQLRLKHYRWATTICISVPTALFLLA